MFESTQATAIRRRTFFFGEIQMGLMAPFDALKFFLNNKGLFVGVIILHVAGFLAFLWGVSAFLLPYLINIAVSHLALNADFASSIAGFIFTISVYVLAVLTYGLLGLPLMNLAASPFFDVVATKAFQQTSGLRLPRTGFSDFLKSFAMEFFKLAFLALLFSASFLSVFVLMAAPIVFLFSLWFYGWQEVDRLLVLMRYSSRERLWFGIKHAAGCASLGVWFYVPLFGSLFGVVMTAAAGIFVAHAQDAADLERFIALGGCRPSDLGRPQHNHDDRR
jgi:hypothetical protein